MSSSNERFALWASMAALLTTFGLARFIYTPLLPLMQEGTGFGDDWAGYLASANYIGYLLGALAATQVHSLELKKTLLRVSVILAALTNIMMGVTQNEWLWMLMRFISGLCSVGGMIIGTSLLMLATPPAQSMQRLSIHFSAIGLGLALGALWVLLFKSTQTWAELWISSGLVIAILGAPALRFNQWSIHPLKQQAINQTKDIPISKLFLALFAAAYFCEGVGYVISATFLVSILQKQTTIPHLGDYAWLVVGLAMAPSCWLWVQLAKRIGEFPALISAYLVQSVGIILPVVSHSELLAIVGAILFGGTVIGIVSMVLIYGGRMAGSKPTTIMGLLTACFGIAQVVAPAFAGWMAERQGHFDTSLILAAAITVLGAVLMWAASIVAKGQSKHYA
ncbi:MAG: YbfB/YjiJ family MFS transporter [Thiofilum sp.]|uniref:YbfB/YjiJ family MFS transporter n=1 Tax=Thiofilum sp. TaxID=2212733 RepID=UPI0025D58096|nr:YbfB/YjiJ family MFS transporter [Thiofilum sp.]MBK8452728.1 YbfB/YjiJ family MFS transporter [Thiofilum sp.]